MRRDLPICATCGVQYGAPREDCPICLDERQYVGWDGQQWTTLAELTAAGHRGRIDEEGPGVIGVGTVPSVAIGQRALLVRAGAGNVLWDCVTYLDDDIVARVDELGGIRAIAISHPHYYGTMIDWASRPPNSTLVSRRRAGAPILTVHWCNATMMAAGGRQGSLAQRVWRTACVAPRARHERR